VQIHGAVQPEQAADADEREAEPELDPAAELRRDDDQQRESRRSIGVAGGDEADRVQRDEVEDRQLESARVFSMLGSMKR